MKKQTVNAGRWVSLFLCALLFTACGGAPLKVEPVERTGNPSDMVAQLGQELQDARGEQVDVLSPTWFTRAAASHNAARQGLDKGSELSGILNHIAQGRAELQQARVVALRSRDQLAEAIESRRAAQAVNAQQFENAYAKAESDFLKLTRAMDDNDFQYARDRQKGVSDQFRELELQAIRQAALGDVQQMLARAKEMDVDDIAPHSFRDAQEAFAQADAHIAQNRYDQQGIQQKAADARFMAERAMVIADASRRLDEMPPEAAALWIESLLSGVNTKLKLTDHRNAAFEDQQTGILAAIGALQSEFASASNSVDEKNQLIRRLGDRLGELEGTSQRVKYDKERLAEEKRFNEQFVTVQGYFTPDEAEVYKQLNQLVIRLKGMQFPVGQAVILPANYDLLSKVQKAIVTFGQPDVIVEGHTDSTGSKQSNQILSEERAESVRQYLVANGTLPARKIMAIGYGFSKPIAPNETAEGRAQNRRIDVIISPRMATQK